MRKFVLGVLLSVILAVGFLPARAQIVVNQIEFCVQDDVEQGTALSFNLANQQWKLFYNQTEIANGTGIISQASGDILVDVNYGDLNVAGLVQPFRNRATLTAWKIGNFQFSITDSRLDDSVCSFAPPPPPPPPQPSSICLIETEDPYNHAQIVFNTDKHKFRLSYFENGVEGDFITGTYIDGPGPDSLAPPVDFTGDVATFLVHGSGTYQNGRFAGSSVDLNYGVIYPGLTPGGIKRGMALAYIHVTSKYTSASSVNDRRLEGGCR